MNSKQKIPDIVEPKEMLRRVNFLLEEGIFLSGLVGHISKQTIHRRAGLAYLLNHPKEMLSTNNPYNRIPMYDVFQLAPRTCQITLLGDEHIDPDDIVLGYDVSNITDEKSPKEKYELEGYTRNRKLREFKLRLFMGTIITGEAYTEPGTNTMKPFGSLENDHNRSAMSIHIRRRPSTTAKKSEEENPDEKFRFLTNTRIIWPYLMKKNTRTAQSLIKLSDPEIFNYGNANLFEDNPFNREIFKYMTKNHPEIKSLKNREQQMQYIVKTLFDQAQPDLSRGGKSAIILKDSTIRTDDHIVKR